MSEYTFNCPDCGLLIATEDKELYEYMLKAHAMYEDDVILVIPSSPEERTG
jgi:hypothetical protein